jgi:hypothetical protein
MQRRHFELIAATVRSLQSIPGADESADYATGYDTARADIATQFANRLAGENPRFDRARFLAACGVQA